MIGLNGGLVGKAKIIIAASSIPGVWTANEQINLTRLNTWAGSGLLDTYPGATAAYSLRTIKTSLSSSPVVRVRRSSDSVEQNFTAQEVTDGTLLTFCGVGNGFVTTWYDQSGNANHATQTLTGEQPRIVASGALETDGGRPTIRFGVTSSSLLTPDILSSPNCAFFAVTRHTNASSTWSFFAGEKYAAGTNRLDVGKTQNASTVHGIFGTTFFTLTGTDIVSKAIGYFQAGVGISQYKLNNNAVGSLPNEAAASTTLMTIGRRGGSGNTEIWYGPIQELIYYPTSQVSTYNGVMANMNTYYSVF